MLLVSELPHPEGHFSPRVCFSGSFATLGYKGQAKPPWIKVFNHATYQKAASLQLYVQYQCPDNTVRIAKICFFSELLGAHACKGWGAPGLALLGSTSQAEPSTSTTKTAVLTRLYQTHGVRLYIL